MQNTKLYQKWITLNLGDVVECKIQIWTRDETSEEDNIKAAVTVLKTKVNLLYEKVNKDVPKNFSWNITSCLGK